jgi:hypothetical protein
MARKQYDTTTGELDAVTLAAQEIGELMIAAGRSSKPVGVEVAALVATARMLAGGLDPEERKRVFDLGMATAALVSGVADVVPR